MATIPGQEPVDSCANPPWCSPPINPSYVQVERLELDGLGLTMFLGGIEPAAPGMTGVGYYANISSDQVSLNNAPITIDLIYDFVPQPGDQFIILQATESITGTFNNFADGDVVFSTADVNLVISYTRTQVVLTAQEM